MIGHLSGKILMRGDRFVILEVNGMGYKIFVIPEVIRKSKGKETLSLWTHLYLREDTMELYGFLEYAEVNFFEMLISISGIGPKSALGILGVAALDTLKQAISSGETEYLTKVSGIGRRTAEKIIIELREKLGTLEFISGKDDIIKGDQDILGALQSLGYSLKEARETLKKIPKEVEGTNNRIKEALRILGK